MMHKAATDTTLWDWRYGQAQAERLCADLLQVEGFQEIDPQCPLGGPDGRKDILCTRDGKRWVAAVYFPTTRAAFSVVKDKFIHDLDGVARHNAAAFAFLTNQRLTPGERADLVQAAHPTSAEIFHQERIRSVLDSPKGYGLRLEYLRIPMTEEEQVGLFSTLGDQITERLTRQEAEIIELHRKVDLVLERTMTLGGGALPVASSVEVTAVPGMTQFPTADLRVGDVMWIHRLLLDGTGFPHANRGRFRSVAVWIGVAGSAPETARFTPSPPADVPVQLDELTVRWRTGYADASAAPFDDRIAALASFHHGFLSIHPFLDGNGRVARALLQQQAFELTGRTVEARFTDDPASYYDALSAADAGNQGPLRSLITANLE